MSMPNNVLSVRPIPAAFMPPRTVLRSTIAQGLQDVHMGGVALNDPSQGLSYQLWTATVGPGGQGIYLAAPNTPAQLYIATSAIWVALSFDQNARPFVAYVTDNTGLAFYRWFDTTISNFRTTQIPGNVFRVFAVLDDPRPVQIQTSDIILAYVRQNTLFSRVERDRFGVEYTLGAAPGKLVQLGINHVLRLQFAFQNVAGGQGLPPQEWNPALGINEPA
jgi:hypothetical protein